MEFVDTNRTGWLVNLGAAECPRECDHFCILKSNGPICSCKPGFRLYDDLKTCVLTEELLEEAAEELSDDVALPTVIVLIVGFLGKFLRTKKSANISGDF